MCVCVRTCVCECVCSYKVMPTRGLWVNHSLAAKPWRYILIDCIICTYVDLSKGCIRIPLVERLWKLCFTFSDSYPSSHSFNFFMLIKLIKLNLKMFAMSNVENSETCSSRVCKNGVTMFICNCRRNTCSLFTEWTLRLTCHPHQGPPGEFL